MNDFERPFTTPPMNPDVKKVWVEALRSGEYRQGTGVLCVIDSKGVAHHCCLGVLCELHKDAIDIRKATTSPFAVQNKYGPGSYVLMYGLTTIDLPQNVRTWAGLRDDNPRFSHDAEVSKEFAKRVYNLSEKEADYTSLALLNDKGYTFAEIADIIEKYL